MSVGVGSGAGDPGGVVDLLDRGARDACHEDEEVWEADGQAGGCVERSVKETAQSGARF